MEKNYSRICIRMLLNRIDEIKSKNNVQSIHNMGLRKKSGQTDLSLEIWPNRTFSKDLTKQKIKHTYDFFSINNSLLLHGGDALKVLQVSKKLCLITI